MEDCDQRAWELKVGSYRLKDRGEAAGPEEEGREWTAGPPAGGGPRHSRVRARGPRGRRRVRELPLRVLESTQVVDGSGVRGARLRTEATVVRLQSWRSPRELI